MMTYTNRKEVPSHEKWNLADIYSDIKKWKEDYLLIEKMAANLKQYDGNIQDGHSLYQYLKQREELSYTFNKIYAYAMLSVDENTRDSLAQSHLDRAKQLS